MRILVLANVDFSKPYGTHTRPFYISKYLQRIGHEVLVLGIRGNNNLDLRNFKELKSMQFVLPFKFMLLIIEIFFYTKLFKPDIIYTHSNMFTISANLSRRLFFSKTTIVFDKHGSWAIEQKRSSYYPILIFFETLALKYADRIVAASDPLKQALIRIYNIPCRKYDVVPNGVDPEVFHFISKNKISILSKELIKDKKILIFPAPRNFISNIISIKFMYNVMDHLYKKDSKIILLITGGGHIIEPKPANVIYTGFIDDLNKYLNISNLAVAPYPEDAQCGGARNKILEYFSSKVPVVSTEHGLFGIPEAKPYVHYIPTSLDPKNFANKILSTLTMDTGTLRNIVDNAHQLILTKYNWRESTRLLNDVVLNRMEF